MNQNLHVNKTYFHMKTRFETEAKCNRAQIFPAKEMMLISVKMCFRHPGQLCFAFVAACLCLTALMVIRTVRQDWDKNGE